MAIDISSLQNKKQTKKDTPKGKSLLQRELFPKKGLSSKQKENLYSQLAVLMTSGMSLSASLKVLIEEAKKNEKTILEGLLKDIIDGKDLFESMEHAKCFSPYEIYSVMIGEETADLQKVFNNLGVYYAEKIEQIRQLISALSYPVIILLSAGIVIFFMIQFVIPTFEEVLLRMGGELPQITQIILSFAAWARAYGLLIVLGIILIVIADQNLNKRSETYQLYRNKFLENLPIIGTAIKISATANFFSALAMLTKSNISILRSFEIVQKMIGYQKLKNEISLASKRIEGGESLHAVIKNFNMFDAVTLNYVKVAEETNQLGHYFQLISDKVKTENAQKIKLLNAALEPFLILIIGGIVGFILIALYLPIFELSNTLG